MISNVEISPRLALSTVVVALVVFELVVILRRLLFSPLARVPGPFITKISHIPIFAYDYRSRRTAWIRGLHEKYGPVVRVSPDEVSVVSPTGIRDVYTGQSHHSGGGGGPFPKSKVFEVFKHFGARNSFTSITSAQHSWRRKIIGSTYSQSSVLAREAATGNVWRVVGDYLSYVDRNGTPGPSAGKSIDVHTANTLYAGDGVSSFVLLHGMQALRGNEKHRQLIIATQEKPGDTLLYLQQEYRDFFNWLSAVQIAVRGFIPGLGPPKLSERTRTGDRDVKKMKSAWIGGSEYRDFGFRNYLEARRALEADRAGPGSVTVKLAANVLAGDKAQANQKPKVEDPGMRGFQDLGNFLTDAGAASETMDHLIAGQDTTSETMSHALQALSLPENKHIQERLRAEILALGLPTDHTHALTSEQLNSIMKSPYIDAVVRETLRLYPPHTTHIHRVTPPGGRVLDGFYLPENTKVGTSAYIVHMNGDVFGSEVGQWRPERWLVDDTEQVRKMEHTLWAFGSGSRGCVGKNLAMVEMKLLLSGIYSHFVTMTDDNTDLESEQNHFRFRSTNRDYSYFPNATGRIAFVEAS